jgi:hypothetical protein
MPLQAVMAERRLAAREQRFVALLAQWFGRLGEGSLSPPGAEAAAVFPERLAHLPAEGASGLGWELAKAETPIHSALWPSRSAS